MTGSMEDIVQMVNRTYRRLVRHNIGTHMLEGLHLHVHRLMQLEPRPLATVVETALQEAPW
eukprot:5985707-Amphidinium_carterae.1